MRALLLLAILALADPSSGYRAEIEKYRHDRIAELTAPNGWLAVRGLFWLHEGANSAGSDPGADIHLPARAPKRAGVFTLSSGTVTFPADPAAHATAQGEPIETFTLDPRAGERSAVAFDSVTLFAIRRGDRIGLRMLDPETPALKNFKGLRYFPLSAEYRFHARFVPYEKLKDVPVPNVLGQLVRMESPGYVEFTLKGRAYRLEPVYETPRHQDLFFIFKDLTSRTDTYEAGPF